MEANDSRPSACSLGPQDSAQLESLRLACVRRDRSGKRLGYLVNSLRAGISRALRCAARIGCYLCDSALYVMGLDADYGANCPRARIRGTTAKTLRSRNGVVLGMSTISEKDGGSKAESANRPSVMEWGRESKLSGPGNTKGHEVQTMTFPSLEQLQTWFDTMDEHQRVCRIMCRTEGYSAICGRAAIGVDRLGGKSALVCERHVPSREENFIRLAH